MILPRLVPIVWTFKSGDSSASGAVSGANGIAGMNSTVERSGNPVHNEYHESLRLLRRDHVEPDKCSREL